jgi:hypothetical protein
MYKNILPFGKAWLGLNYGNTTENMANDRVLADKRRLVFPFDDSHCIRASLSGNRKEI